MNDRDTVLYLEIHATVVRDIMVTRGNEVLLESPEMRAGTIDLKTTAAQVSMPHSAAAPGVGMVVTGYVGSRKFSYTAEIEVPERGTSFVLHEAFAWVDY